MEEPSIQPVNSARDTLSHKPPGGLRSILIAFAIATAVAAAIAIVLPALGHRYVVRTVLDQLEAYIDAGISALIAPGQLDAPLRDELRVAMDLRVTSEQDPYEFVHLSLVSPSGFVAYSSAHERIGQQSELSEAAKRALSGQSLLELPDEASDAPDLVRIAVPLQTAAGEVIGALEADLTDSFVDERLETVHRVATVATIAGFFVSLIAANGMMHLRQRRTTALLAAMEAERAEAERRSRRMELTAELVRIVSAGFDEASAFRAVTTELQKLLHFDRISIIGPRAPGGPIEHLHAFGPNGHLDARSIESPTPGSWPARTIRDGRAIVVDDLAGPERSEHDHRISQSLGVRSLICLPLVHHGSVIAALSIAAAKPGQYTMEQAIELEPVTRALATAIVNARLYRDAVRGREHAEAMLDIGSALTSELDYRTVLERIANHAIQLTGAAFAYVAVPGEDIFKPAAIAGNDGGYVATIKFTDDPSSRYGHGPGGRAARERRPVVVDDVLTGDPNAPWVANMSAHGIRSAVSVPLVLRDRLIGILAAYSYTPGWFNAERVSLLSTFAHFAAVAVENARLFAEVGQVEAVRELARLRTEFVSLVSHELRNPLTALTGWIEVLLAKPYDQSFVETAAAELDRHSRQLQRLVDDLLELSRFDSHRFKLNRQPVDLRELANEVARDAVHMNSDHRIAVTTESDVPIVQADPGRIRQVLDNLVSNACRYSPSGTQVTIEIVRGRRRGEVLVRVRDQGIGLPADQLERIFDRFYRDPRTTVQNRPGTGLGLALCRAIIEAHGGSIWAESPGIDLGSTFFFTLPFMESRGRDSITV